MKSSEHLLNDSKFFCMAPWITMHFWPNGQAFPCCVILPEGDDLKQEYMGNLNNSSIGELWNTDQMRELRRNMIADKPSKSCRRCYQQEKDANVRTLRKSLNEDFGDMFDRVADTHEDGSHDDPRFYYWDVRFNNLCNLRCLSCGPNFSSSWFNDAKKMWDYNDPALLELPKTFWDDALPAIKEVRHAYFAGGEPLITAEHYKMLDTWIDSGNTDINISYTTNFTKTHLGKKRVFDYWNKFSNVNVGASLDDNWVRAEYLRKDTIWTDVVKNRREMLAECPNTDFFLSSTISAYNVWHWPDFHREWIEEGLVSPHALNLTILTHPERLSIQLLPKDYKRQVAEKWEKHIEYVEDQKRKSQPEWDVDSENLKGIIKFMYANDTFDDKFNEFLWITTQTDIMRENDAFAVYPELEQLKQYEIMPDDPRYKIA
jgi:radical SAM protein with 4Fe4S-binding SPASM domain